MRMFDGLKTLSLKRRFTISVLTSVVMILILFGSIWGFSTVKHNNDALTSKISTTSELASIGFSDSLWNFDDDGINSIINGLFKDVEIGMVSVTQSHGGDSIIRQKPGAVYQELTFKTLPIFHEKTEIGKVRIGITPYFRNQEFYQAIGSFAEGILLMIVFIWLSISAVSKAVTKPILDLAVGTEAIVNGDLTIRLNADIGGEVGELAEKFNMMSEHLHASMQERDRTLAALEASEEKFNKAFRYVADAIGIISLSTEKYLEVNDAFTKMLGYEKDVVIGHSSNEFRLWHSGEARAETYRMLRMNGIFRNFESQWNTASGEVRTGRSSAEVIEIGGEKCVLFVWFDITDQKRVEEKLQHVNEELEEKVTLRTRELSAMNLQLTAMYNELQSAHKQVIQQEKMASIGQLAAGVAHEINNPLGFIICNIESLKVYKEKINTYISKLEGALQEIAENGQPSADPNGIHGVVREVEEVKKSIKIDYLMEDMSELLLETTEGANRVKTIVQDLKTFSRTVVQATETDINKDIQSVINILWNEMKYKVTLNKDFGELPPVWCNANEIIQVFMNLLHNAAQAIEEEGEIEIKTWVDDGFVHVSIADTGTGMSEDVLDRIFEPFYTTKDIGSGTGLGLSIAYEIIKNHKGSIEVTSSPGNGSVFDVKIPIVSQM